MTCKKTQEFLGSKKVRVLDQADARKLRLGKKEALTLARQMESIVSTKGTKTVRLNLKQDRVSDDEILDLIMGPSGNLRAPAVKKGKTLLIGFNEGAYSALFS